MSSVSQKSPITRIEFRKYPIHNGGIQVSKYEDGWTAGSNPAERSIQTEQTLDDMLNWLGTRGWTIYRWPACRELGVVEGATAFKGRPLPKRTRSAILELRDEIEQKTLRYFERYRGTDPAEIPALPIQTQAIDLAYML